MELSCARDFCIFNQAPLYSCKYTWINKSNLKEEQQYLETKIPLEYIILGSVF